MRFFPRGDAEARRKQSPPKKDRPPTFAARLAARVNAEKAEIAATAGLLLIVAGVAMWSRPLAMILAGVLLFAYGYLTVPRAKSVPSAVVTSTGTAHTGAGHGGAAIRRDGEMAMT